jgi:hypothetical protein
MRKTLGMIAAAVLLIMAACGGSSSHTVHGDLTASTGTFSSLSGGGGSDVSDGDQVTAKDESGKTIGTGVVHEHTCKSSQERLLFNCFTFTINDVGNAKFYEFQVNRHGSDKFSRSKLEQMHWRVSLSLT